MNREYVEELCRKAAQAKFAVQECTAQKKNEVLEHAADLLTRETDNILAANAEDVTKAEADGMKPAMVDRLTLSKERIAQMAEGLREVAALPDPVGELLDDWTLANGLRIRKVRVPLGVIGIIYESRPNVTADAFALTFKSGNAVVLKGGSDAIRSNEAIIEILRRALEDLGVTKDAACLIDSTDRADTGVFLEQRQTVDVLIPRGSAGLISYVVRESKIPVIETGSGNCHIYVDADADLQKAIPIILNAKTQRTGVCNAAESLVVHESVKDAFLPMLSDAMHRAGVKLYADDRSRVLLPYAEAATEEDYGREYLDLMLSVKTVSSLEEAIEHINRYHTKHSDCIITENQASADLFQRLVDSACVYVNASTRFTDGFEFGFGAEIGISTQKLHARGPMGLKELTSYKYLLNGNGQVRA